MRRSWCLCVWMGLLVVARPASAQMTGPLGINDSRVSSGTSWLPDESPSHGGMHHGASWMTMWHWDAFVQAIESKGPRGDFQAGSINWMMASAERHVFGGPLTLRAMMSLEPLTVGRCGFPVLGQSGETCRGDALHD